MWINQCKIIPLGIIKIIIFGVFYQNAFADNCRPKACSRSISNEKAMCGSDGLSYPSRCQFERARCQNKSLTLIRRGACKEQRPCTEWALQGNQTAFKAACRASDGTYESTQCHLDTGFCWCVTPQGVPLPYTTVRRKPDGKTKCGRKKTKRRSPNKKHRNRPCKQPDKAIFNNNLINIFHSEYSRERALHHSLNNGSSDTIVTSWKFSLLDTNRDDFLDKPEYRDLRRVVKKALKPKRCARNFVRACDVNGDQRISRPEWVECLTRDGMGDGHSGGGGGGGNAPNSSSDFSTNDDEDETEDHFISPPHGVLSSETGSMSPNDDDESPEVHEDDPTDCLSDRRTALADGYNLYVPECTSDGRYQKVQCYKSAGYCWCVNEDSGKNIPGTSVKNATPKCDQLKTSNKTMKGCPDEKKAVFLRDLLQYMHTKMSSGNSLNGMPWITSKEEQAATWSFVIFDKNQNKMLERSEWKAFKDMVAGVKGLRKCGKKLPRYCDNNRDRQISMTEWLECLNVQNGRSNSGSVASTTANNRAGKQNPLSMLIED